MNAIANFRKCTLSNDELLRRVDAGTDNLYRTREIPSRHIPARPDHDYDLLVGELVLRFQELEAENKRLTEELEAEKERFIRYAQGKETDIYVLKETVKKHVAENKRLREALIDAKEDAAALIEQHRWIPVTERLPKKMEEVIVTNEEDEWVCSGYLHLDGNWYNQFESPDWGDVEIIITHWQPLPQPPKEQ